MCHYILFFISVTMLSAQESTPAQLAQAQLDAYNSRDIEAFLIPYADSIKVYTFPNRLLYQGKNGMRLRYAGMFEKTTDLFCKLVNRIVQNDTVIDQELVTANGRKFDAIAIYKVKGNKIIEVYFIQ